MKAKILFLVSLLFVISATLSSCGEEADITVTLEDGIYLGVYGTTGGAAYEVKSSKITPLTYTWGERKTVIVDAQTFVAVPNDETGILPFVCFKSELTKDDYQPAVAGDQNKEFLGLYFVFNNQDASHNDGLFIAIKESSQTGFCDISFFGVNGAHEKTVGAITTEDDHQKLSFSVTPEVTKNYENKNENWHITFSPLTGYQFGTNVIMIHKETGQIMSASKATL